nr:MAG TPA: Head Tail Connector Protein [Bacteriophage sp.]
MHLQLDQIKKHLNIDVTFHDDDEYLCDLAVVAEKAIEKHIDNTFDNIMSGEGGEIPPPLVHAMLLFIGHLYSNREPIAFTSNTEISFTLSYLLDMFRNYKGGQK